MSISFPGQHTGPHRWSATRMLGTSSYSTPSEVYYFRECEICGWQEYGVTPFSDIKFWSEVNEEFSKTLESSPFSSSFSSGGSVSGNQGYQGPSKGVMTINDGTEIQATGSGTPVANYGGIVAFDPSRAMVQLGDGGELPLDMLLYANPGIPESFMMERLKNLPSKFFTPSDLAARAMAVNREKLNQPVQAFARLRDLLEEMGSTDDALTLILETIRNAGSPEAVRELASEWLTKVTTEISKITRALDEEEE